MGEKINSTNIAATYQQQCFTFLEKTNLIFLVVDEQGVIRFISENVGNVLHHKADYWIGKKITDTVTSNSIPTVEGIQKDQTSTPVSIHSISFKNVPYSERFFDGKAVPCKLDEGDGYTLYLHDVTHLKRQQDRLMIENRALSDFVAKVSHDLKAPLQSIQGLVNLGNQDKENLNRYLGLIHTNVDRLQQYIHQLAQYTRQDASLKLDCIDFQNMIEEVFKSHEYMPNAQRITLKVRLDQKAPVYSNEFMLKLVLNNMISNAIKYHNFDQKRPRINVTVKSNTKEYKLYVRDNGTGIEEDRVPCIFERFERASTQPGGSGLGLYLIKNTLEKIGGEINVKSKKGEGTEFVVSVPNKAMIDCREPLASKVPGTWLMQA
ncbi:MAG: HAMP domain-containing histidine kinase [Cytophagales bacterium]|nr:HAMP domain-containing histidine kinase [Cytophagales bacterium]